MMLNDHQSNNKMLLTLATQKIVSLPPAIDDKAQGTIDELKDKSGDEFDKADTRDMVDTHKDMMDLLENAAKESKDNDIRIFAQRTLPIVQHHLNMAQELVQANAK
jgi:putative membrane protein